MNIIEVSKDQTGHRHVRLVERCLWAMDDFELVYLLSRTVFGIIISMGVCDAFSLAFAGQSR